MFAVILLAGVILMSQCHTVLNAGRLGDSVYCRAGSLSLRDNTCYVMSCSRDVTWSRLLLNVGQTWPHSIYRVAQIIRHHAVTTLYFCYVTNDKSTKLDDFCVRQHYAIARTCYRPSVCPSHVCIIEQESCAIAKMTARCHYTSRSINQSITGRFNVA